jgi:glycosyltransferase involved in cell wall biosynthesis
MRILLAHNRYVTRGGEDAVFDQERDLLREHGHDVIEYLRDNRELAAGRRIGQVADAIWSRDSARVVGDLLDEHRPDVVHVHNTWPQLTPAIYYAAAHRSVPVVQTLHNYRLLCANAMLLRNGAVCEDCVGKRLAWPAIQHKCYRSDRAASAVMVASTGIHRALGTWRHRVTRYVALSEFSREKLLDAGLPPDRVVIKPNFASDRHGDADLNGPRSGGLFVGRLSVEKGVDVLLEAWQELTTPLRLVGPGDFTAEQRELLVPAIERMGFVDDPTLMSAMREASFMVVPSLVYEGFPMVVAEAYAAGLPIIASRLGALAELVEDGQTGLHYTPGDASDLADKVRWAAGHPEEMRVMGEQARKRYEDRYAPEANYRRLMEIYADALDTGVAGVSEGEMTE